MRRDSGEVALRGERVRRSRHKQDPCIIGVDIGTTGCRSTVFDSEGNILASQGAEYPIIYLPGGGAEQDPEVIFSQMLAVIKASIEEAKISPSSVATLSLSSVFHTLIALDGKGRHQSHHLVRYSKHSICGKNSRRAH